MPNEHNELSRLRAENLHFKALLTTHGIDASGTGTATIAIPSAIEPQPQLFFSPEQKIRIFMDLFRGREDVYPLRWESSKGKSG